MSDNAAKIRLTRRVNSKCLGPIGAISMTSPLISSTCGWGPKRPAMAARSYRSTLHRQMLKTGARGHTALVMGPSVWSPTSRRHGPVPR